MGYQLELDEAHAILASYGLPVDLQLNHELQTMNTTR